MLEIWSDVLVIVVCTLASGFFAAAEIAIVSMRRSRIQELVEQKNGGAILVQRLLSNPDKFFAVVQIGMTVLPSGASVLGGVFAVKYLQPIIHDIPISWIAGSAESIAVGIIVILLSYFTLVIGELAPKSLGLSHAEGIALFSSHIIIWVLKILSGVITFITTSTNLVLKPFRDRTTFIESRISEEEFRLLLSEGTRSGAIEKTEQELIESIFEFTDKTAKDIMIPRTDIVALEINDSRETIIRTVIEQGYTRMPVYAENLDKIIGEIYAKDLIALMEHHALIVMQDLLRPAYFVPETKKIHELLREFQAKKLHLAIVVDEFGGTAGLVTMEDILEEIVGDINDEYDEVIKEIEMQPDGSAFVSAALPIHEVNEKLGVSIPEDESYETLAGYVIKTFGRIPEVNDRKRADEVEITVTKKSSKRINQVRIRKLPERKTA
ncbi:MAG TPA: hemolysin family protein [Candidatus Kapabacteria bacterium]|nr:hemolysin family protein [Candidatus Kapabacteria bacterium]